MVLIKRVSLIKILFFGHSSNTEGAERTLFEIIKELCETENYEITLILPNDQGEMYQFYRKLDIKIILMPLPWILTPEKNSNIKFAYLRFLIWKIQFNFRTGKNFIVNNDLIGTKIVITNTSVIPWGGYFAKKYGYKHIWMIREDISDTGNMISISKKIDIFQEINNLSDYVMYPSNFVKNKLKDKINRRNKVLYSAPKYNYSDLKSLFEYKDDVYYISWIGSLTEQKNPLATIEIAKALLKLRTDFQIHIFGVGNLKNKLMEKITEMGLSKNIIYRGHTQNLAAELSNFDFSISTSRNEAFGRSLVESCEFGVIPIYRKNSSWEERFETAKVGYTYSNFNEIATLIHESINNGSIVMMKNLTKKQFHSDFFLDLPSKTVSETISDIVKGTYD